MAKDFDRKVQEYRDKNGGLYPSRYAGRKAASGDEVVVKVEGGYKLMTPQERDTWKKQK